MDAKPLKPLTRRLALRMLRPSIMAPQVLCLSCLCLCLCLCRSAAAEPVDAKPLRKLAFERFATRDYAGGIAALQDAHAADPHPEDLYNLAVAHEKRGDCAAALEHLQRYVLACPSCARVGTAKERTALLGALCGGKKGSELATLPPVHVQGWAELRGDRKAAREEAVRDGLRQAVEMAAGVEIAARYEDMARSRLDGDRERFEQQVTSVVNAHSRGFVRRHEVLAAKEKGRLLEVDLVVEVDASRLRTEVEQIAERIERARYPKLVVHARETYVGPAGERPSRHFEAFLRSRLAARGLDISVAPDDPDYRLDVTATVRHTGSNRRGAGEHYGDAEIALSLTDLAAGTLVFEDTRTGHAPSSIFSEADLSKRAVEHVGTDLPERLLGALLEHWAQVERAGVRYRVELHGGRYEREGRAFIEALRDVIGVSELTERGQSPGVLHLEFRYPAGVDRATLRGDIQKKLDRHPSLSKLSAETRGRTLIFRLLPGGRHP